MGVGVVHKEQTRGRAPQTVVGRERRIKEEGEGRREGKKEGREVKRGY